MKLLRPVALCLFGIVAVNSNANELLVHYGFNGSAADLTGNGNNGTISGAPAFVAGEYGQAIDFENPAGQNTGTQFVSLPNAPDITSLSNDSFSFALLYKSGDTSQNNGRLFGNLTNAGGTNQGLAFDYNSNATPNSYAIISGATGIVSTEFNTGGYTTDGQWHWEICVLDRSSQQLYQYVDNNLVSTQDITSLGSVSLNDLEIGRVTNQPTFAALDTSVDDFQLYDFALSPDQVNTLVTTGTAPEPSAVALLGVAGLSLLGRRKR